MHEIWLLPLRALAANGVARGGVPAANDGRDEKISGLSTVVYVKL